MGVKRRGDPSSGRPSVSRREFLSTAGMGVAGLAARGSPGQPEADAIVEKAEADSKAMVERRKKMAEDKISAAERDAVDEVRESAAIAAAAASRRLIAERHDAEADRKLADQVISSI